MCRVLLDMVHNAYPASEGLHEHLIRAYSVGVGFILSRHNLADTGFFSECFYSIHGEPETTKLILLRSILSCHNLTDTCFF